MKTKDLLDADIVERDQEPVNFYAEDDGYGIVGWSFDCPYCGYENRFVMDESNPDHECRECGRSIKLVPITYTMTAE